MSRSGPNGAAEASASAGNGHLTPALKKAAMTAGTAAELADSGSSHIEESSQKGL